MKQHLYERAKTENERVVKIHTKKFKLLNNGIAGQDYETLKTKVLHNISSYALTLAEERLLCRGLNFCIEAKPKNYLEFQTDIELNISKIEDSCHPSTFKAMCRKMYGYCEQLIRTNKKKLITNISEEELEAINSLKKQ